MLNHTVPHIAGCNLYTFPASLAHSLAHSNHTRQLVGLHSVSLGKQLSVCVCVCVCVCRRRVAALEAQIARTRELLSAGAGVTQTHVSQTPASALEVQG